MISSEVSFDIKPHQDLSTTLHKVIQFIHQSREQQLDRQGNITGQEHAGLWGLMGGFDRGALKMRDLKTQLFLRIRK